MSGRQYAPMARLKRTSDTLSAVELGMVRFVAPRADHFAQPARGLADGEQEVAGDHARVVQPAESAKTIHDRRLDLPWGSTRPGAISLRHAWLGLATHRHEPGCSCDSPTIATNHFPDDAGLSSRRLEIESQTLVP